MVLATRTSAPNTSLAVIRPKPRPDSPTASEISVIMLKSELPHEAPNPVSKKTTRVHHAPRRRGGRMAARSRRAAGGDPGDRFPRLPVSRRDCGTAALIPPRSQGDRLYRGRERGDHPPLRRE